MGQGLLQAGASSRGAALLSVEMQAAVPPDPVDTGHVLARQGEPGRRFYFVQSGAVDVVVTSAEGLRLPVARLGPGSHFGEMSLLAGITISADVVAAEPSVLRSVSAEEFHELLGRKPELVEYLASELAVRLRRTNHQLAAQQRRQAALSGLISSRYGTACRESLPSFGRVLTDAIRAAGASSLPLLITGEPGVGKKALALSLHAAGARRESPVLVVDCRELPAGDARTALFGDAEPQAVSRFAERLGYLQAADRGTLVLARVEWLPEEVQDDLAAFLSVHPTAPDDYRVRVRVIGTAGPEAAEGGEPRPLSASLSAVFGSSPVIRLLPLRRRRRDVVPLAEHFLQQAAQLSGWPAPSLSESAKRALLSHEFHSENVEELRQVVSLGLDLAENGVVSAEHLFFGAGIGADSPQLDLLRWPLVERLLTRGRLLGLARALTGAGLAAFAVVCLLAPAARVAQVANAMVWGLWWPALALLSLLLGRVWCAVCPLGSGAEAAQRCRGRGLSPAGRLKEAWPLPALIGFVAIVWVEYVTRMGAHPRATAVLLLSLAALAATFGWLYQRHTWCRYLCPLGAMCAAFSTVSGLRVRARRDVCQGSCTGNECYKGSARSRGCPMFNHALFLNGGEHCKLCLDCVRACPVQAPRLSLRLPLRDLWHSELVPTDLAPLAAVVGLMALLLAATAGGNAPQPVASWWFTCGSLAAAAIGTGLFAVFRSARWAEAGGTREWVSRVVYAYSPVMAAALFGFHVLALSWLRQVSLRVGFAEQTLLEVPVLRLVQVGVIGLGGLMTLWALWRLCRQRFGRAPTAIAAWAPLGALALAYLTAVGVLLGRA